MNKFWKKRPFGRKDLWRKDLWKIKKEIIKIENKYPNKEISKERGEGRSTILMYFKDYKEVYISIKILSQKLINIVLQSFFC